MSLSPMYLAGLFDGEGCLYVFEISCKRKHGVIKQMMARVMISNSHLPVLEIIQAQWGGRIHELASKPKKLANYRLDICSQDPILKILTDMQPYLLIKKDQVDLFMVDYAPTMRGSGKYLPLTPEQHAKRREVKEKLSALKRISHYAQETSIVQ